MKKSEFYAVAATFVATTAVLSGLVSCKGRTMENMEPTGDTVEVTVNREAREEVMLPDSTGMKESSESRPESPEDRIPEAYIPDQR
ncbi:MAG: hypothetical protein K2J70_03905 [Muribaculaceae bacterium]|nr:hypothetical protein [Muribaculaceae bacterium]